MFLFVMFYYLAEIPVTYYFLCLAELKSIYIKHFIVFLSLIHLYNAHEFLLLISLQC